MSCLRTWQIDREGWCEAVDTSAAALSKEIKSLHRMTQSQQNDDGEKLTRDDLSAAQASMEESTTSAIATLRVTNCWDACATPLCGVAELRRGLHANVDRAMCVVQVLKMQTITLAPSCNLLHHVVLALGVVHAATKVEDFRLSLLCLTYDSMPTMQEYVLGELNEVKRQRAAGDDTPVVPSPSLAEVTSLVHDATCASGKEVSWVFGQVWLLVSRGTWPSELKIDRPWMSSKRWRKEGHSTLSSAIHITALLLMPSLTVPEGVL